MSWWDPLSIYQKDSRRGVVVISTAYLHSTNPELRFYAGSHPACGLLDICYSENLLQCSRLQIRLNTFHRPTTRQKQFINSSYVTSS